MLTLSPTKASNLMRLARDHIAKKTLKATELTIMDHLLFRAREPGSDRTQVSLTSLQRNLNLRRETLVQGLRNLEAAKLLTKVKSWIRVEEGGMFVNRQAVNVYVFNLHPPESGRRTVFPEGKRTRLCPYKAKGVLEPRQTKREWNRALEMMLAKFADTTGLTVPAPGTEIVHTNVPVVTAAPVRKHAPTLWDLRDDYPGMVKQVIPNAEKPHNSRAEVAIPWSPDIKAMMRNCGGSYWVKAREIWSVPGYSARNLGEVLWTISQRLRSRC